MKPLADERDCCHNSCQEQMPGRREADRKRMDKLTLQDGRTVSVESDHPRGGLAMTFDLSGETSMAKSPVWNTAGWQIQFLHLAPDQVLYLPSGRHMLKVIAGKEMTTGRSCFARDGEVRTTWLPDSLPQVAVDGSENVRIVSGESGLLAALVTETAAVASNLHDMSQVEFSGPHAEKLQWLSFKDRFGAFTSYFDDLDNHMADGFHLSDVSDGEICYVNFWTCGLGGDVSTHNHGQPATDHNPAFAEVHLVLNNAAGESGMYLTQSPESLERQGVRMLRGEEHGPFFHHKDGMPEQLPNGAVSYPWHGWESLDPACAEAAYDFVVAFEIYPNFAKL